LGTNGAFPAAISDEQAEDPFLMCDYFDVVESTGKASHEDEFPVNWHPHRGFDIASYLRSGTGRHADSLGNRETYETPGMQWMSTGSGVEHAEGGANDKGQRVQIRATGPCLQRICPWFKWIRA
jgi:redox-sensitive bicupin YhaK (pirin superfamily)